MLLVENLAAWISAGVTVGAFENSLPDKTPDEAIGVVDTGGLGGGVRVEGALDAPTFQVLVRAASGTRARDIAFAVDRLMLEAAGAVIGGVYVTDSGRVGGRPAYMTRDDKRREIYAGNYWLESERKAAP